MNGLIADCTYNGVITVNRVVLKPEYTVDDLQVRVAVLRDNVKTYHSDSGCIGYGAFSPAPRLFRRSAGSRTSA